MRRKGFCSRCGGHWCNVHDCCPLDCIEKHKCGFCGGYHGLDANCKVMAKALQQDAEKLEALTGRIHDERILEAYVNPHAKALGKLGGKVKSEAKAAAARKNGKKGGRPKKAKLPL